MKIGFEAKRFYHNKTGLGNYSRDLIRILVKYYPNNYYFLYNHKKSIDEPSFSSSKNVVQRNPIIFFFKIFTNLWRQFGVIGDIKKDNVEVFHGLSGELPFGIKLCNVKTIVTIHDLIFIRYPNLYSFIDRKVYFFKFKKAAQNANLIIAISEQTKKDIVNFLNIDQDKVKVIYQGCQDVFKKQYSEDKKKAVIIKFNLPYKFVLNVGTLEERKNAFTIVKAVKRCNVDLVLIGKETKYSKKIKDFIKSNHLENRVHFLKGVSSEELAIIYQLSSVFVYPSIFEGFGIPIIEALYSRTPVITNCNGVFPEAGGPNSIYIEPFDETALENSINLVLTDKVLADKMRDEGEKFVQKFNDDKIAKQFMEVYLSL